MLDFDNLSSQHNYFVDETVMSICYDVSKLIPILEHTISQKIPDYVYRNCLKKQLGSFDGKSSERIANRILKFFD